MAETSHHPAIGRRQEPHFGQTGSSSHGLQPLFCFFSFKHSTEYAEQIFPFRVSSTPPGPSPSGPPVCKKFKG